MIVIPAAPQWPLGGGGSVVLKHVPKRWSLIHLPFCVDGLSMDSCTRHMTEGMVWDFQDKVTKDCDFFLALSLWGKPATMLWGQTSSVW